MSEVTDLVVINNNTPPPAIIEDSVNNGNWGDDDDEKVDRPEYLQIKQSSTENPVADTLPNGSFFDSSGNTWDGNSIEMIVFKASAGRGWKPSAPLFVKGEKFLCRSNDRKVPLVATGLVPQAKSCDTCSRSSWKNYNKDTKTGKPVCDESFYIYFLDRANDKPYIYTASRVSAVACEAMKEVMRKLSKKELEEKGYRPSTFEYVVKATTVKEGKNYQIKFESIARLKSEEAAKYKDIFDKMLAAYNQNEDADSDTDGTPGYDPGDDTGAVIDGSDEPAVEI